MYCHDLEVMSLKLVGWNLICAVVFIVTDGQWLRQVSHRHEMCSHDLKVMGSN